MAAPVSMSRPQSSPAINQVPSHFDPRERQDPKLPNPHNYRIYVLTLLSCFGSWMFGYNIGVIGGTIVLPSFHASFNLPPMGTTAYNTIQANIVSMLQIGGLVGSLGMFFIIRRYGRRWGLIGSAGIYLIGAILQTVSNGNLGMMYGGRVVTGLGAGGVTVVVPLYIAEWAPPSIRGRLVGLHEVNNQISSLLGYWCNYIVSIHIPSTSARQWQIPLAMQIVPSALLLLVSLLILPESPRYLIQVGRTVQARKVLSFVRHLGPEDPYIEWEMSEIEGAVARERALRSTEGVQKRSALARELLWPGNRNRMLIGLGLMVGQNMTGINGINFYTPTIFKAIGFDGENVTLLASGMYAIVKTIATIVSLLVLIDRAGRRKLLLISAIGSSAALWYIGGYVTAAHIDLMSAPVGTRSPAGWVAIVCVYLYAAFFSLAWNGVVWVYCAEIYPARIKELAVCLTTATQWITQFAVARAAPYMLSSLKGGFFFFFAACIVVSGLFVLFLVPETKGRSLEKMNELFGTPHNRNAVPMEAPTSSDYVAEKDAEISMEEAPTSYALDLVESGQGGIRAGV